MSSLPLLHLSQVLSASRSEVGEKAYYLAKLDAVGFPIPKTLVAPQALLREISEANKLPAYISALSSEGTIDERHSRQALCTRIRTYIEHQEVPENLAFALLKQLEATFGSSFVAVRTSEDSFDASNFHHALLHVRGNSNIVQSILKAWANEFTEQTLIQRLAELSKTKAVPTACIIQELVDADVSGIAFTQHPTTQLKQTLLIASTWGIGDHLTGTESDLDTYEVDTRTLHITKRKIALKTTEHVRTDTGNQHKVVSKDVMLMSSLTDKHIALLADLVTRLKRHHLEHLKVRWCFRFLDPYIVGVEVFTPEQIDQNSQHKKIQKTRTKILISVNNPHRVNGIDRHNIDGFGLIKSEFTWQKLDQHPLYLLDKQRHSLIKHELTKTLGLFVEKLSPEQRCVYQPLSLSSAELRNLGHGLEYERKEENPALGFNGSLRLVHQPELLTLEVAAVQQLASQYNRTICFLLPNVRSLFECKRLTEMVNSRIENQNVQVWFELATPYAVAELAEFLAFQPQGLVINANTLMALSGGYDQKNSDISHFFIPEQMRLLEKYIYSVAKTVHTSTKQIPVFLSLTDPTYDTVKAAIENNISGIVVPSDRTQLLKRLVVTIEQDN